MKEQPKREKCPECKGMRYREVYHDDSEIVAGEVECDDCGGKGWIYDEPIYDKQTLKELHNEN